jgi:hypothetical protein
MTLNSLLCSAVLGLGKSIHAINHVVHHCLLGFMPENVEDGTFSVYPGVDKVLSQTHCQPVAG